MTVFEFNETTHETKQYIITTYSSGSNVSYIVKSLIIE